MHCLETLAVVIATARGDMVWQQAYQEKDAMLAVNKKFVDDTEGTIKTLFIILTFLRVSVDILAITSLKYANLIIYVQILSLSLITIVPLPNPIGQDST